MNKNDAQKKVIDAGLADQVSRPHDCLEGKVRPARGGRSVYEFQNGDFLEASTGRWVKKERVIDRQNDNYLETIVDTETGRLIHHCEEPLSRHRRHGTAKPGIRRN